MLRSSKWTCCKGWDYFLDRLDLMHGFDERTESLRVEEGDSVKEPGFWNSRKEFRIMLTLGGVNLTPIWARDVTIHNTQKVL